MSSTIYLAAPRAAILASVLVAWLLAGCAADLPQVDAGMDVTRDIAVDVSRDAPANCPAGELRCDPGTNQSRRCDGHGGFNETIDCRATGRTCVSGIGCAVCHPDE